MPEPIFVRSERSDSFALIVIDRLERTAILPLARALTEAENEPSVRALILAGAGAFSSVDELPAELASLLERSGKPVIGAIAGEASGGGCELALLCTWRIASASAAFSVPGFSKSSGGMLTRLSRQIGSSRALELILTGEPVGAEEALRIGLFDRLVGEGGELLQVCREFARRLGRNAPLAVRSALAALNYTAESSLAPGMQRESSLFSSCFATEDFREGVDAFLEKREPVFKGE